MPTDTRLIINGDFAENIWRSVDDDTALDDTPCIISLDRLEAEAAPLAARNAPLGVILRGGEKEGDDVHRLAPHLDKLALIAVEFPVFRNGRGYSTARILREQMGFTGEIRACGEVWRDQWQFMQRCGINAFEVPPDTTLETFKEACGELSEVYQPAADGIPAVPWRRN